MSLVRQEAVPAKLSSVPDDFPLITVVENNRAMLSAKLPAGYTLEGMLVELYLASRKQPDLMKAHPDDLVPALCEALETGGTIGKDVYLLTFSSKRKPTPDVVVALNYMFKAELVVRAGGARSIDAFPVYSNEKFAVALGSNPSIQHQPLSARQRGHLIGAYAVAQMGFGVVKVHWCDQDSIETLRQNSRAWSPKMGYVQCPDWYGPKTAVHRLVKLLPKNPRLTRILGKIQQEDELEFGGDPDEIARVEPPAKTESTAVVQFDGPSHISGEDPEPEQEKKQHAELSLDDSRKLVVRGKRLDEFRASALRDIGQWASEKCDEAGEDSEYARLVAGCHRVLRAYETKELAEPPKAQKEKADDRKLDA